MARRTIASLELELAKVQGQAERFAREATEADRRVSSFDAEAKAIAGCIAALDGNLGNDSRTLGWGKPEKVQRILRFLADRYGVTWYDPPVLPVPPLPGWATNQCDTAERG